MSTEHQKYSTENQAEEIHRYAVARGIDIVRTYADKGRSGLRLDGRHALKRLLDDVQNQRTDFSCILVYDVSRWGRFQDADESAYYEFVCKLAGITVQYVAEQFENDGSISATVIKAIKRAMAAEYSRELSTKVFVGHCRLVNLGFRQGGTAGYGLRRLLVDEHRRPKFILNRGEHKSITTDRILLVPGPPEEVEVVRRIYRMFVDGCSAKRIAATLNREGIVWRPTKRWAKRLIEEVLTSEKYIGNNVYNRTSTKLKRKLIFNPPEMWVRAAGAFTPIVDIPLFEAAQRIAQEWQDRFSEEKMLAHLQDLLAKRGALSVKIVDDTPDIFPKHWNYVRVFGGLARAFEMIGYSPRRDFAYVNPNRRLRSNRPDMIAEITALFERAGATVGGCAAKNLLILNGDIQAAIVITRVRRGGGYPGGPPYSFWQVSYDAVAKPDLSIVVRMDPQCERVRDYYVIPWMDFGSCSMRIHEENRLALDIYRFGSLDDLSRMTARIPITEWRALRRTIATSKGIDGLRSLAEHTFARRLSLGKPVALAARNDHQWPKVVRAEKLLQVYQRHGRRQLLLMHKAIVTRYGLAVLVRALGELSGDERLLTLLQAEGIHTVPAAIGEWGRTRHHRSHAREDAHSLQSDGVCVGAAEILKGKSIKPGTLDVLRHMKPARQIRAAETMKAACCYSTWFALTLWIATQPRDLIKADRQKILPHLARAEIARLRTEMRIVRLDARAVQASYSTDVLRLVLGRAYFTRLIGNPAIEQYLQRKHPQMLADLRLVITMTALAGAPST